MGVEKSKLSGHAANGGGYEKVSQLLTVVMSGGPRREVGEIFWLPEL